MLPRLPLLLLSLPCVERGVGFRLLLLLIGGWGREGGSSHEGGARLLSRGLGATWAL